MNRIEILDETLKQVRQEVISAIGKFPEFNSAHEGYAVIKEELDELWYEVMNNKEHGAIERQRKEALQVAAMGIRYMMDIRE